MEDREVKSWENLVMETFFLRYLLVKIWCKSLFCILLLAFLNFAICRHIFRTTWCQFLVELFTFSFHRNIHRTVTLKLSWKLPWCWNLKPQGTVYFTISNELSYILQVTFLHFQFSLNCKWHLPRQKRYAIVEVICISFCEVQHTASHNRLTKLP